MSLLNDFELVVLDLQFKQRDLVAGDELRRDRATPQLRVLLRTPGRVLRRLHRGYLVAPALGLHRNDVMTPVLVQPDIQLVDLDLADALDAGAQMVLQ